MKKSPDIILTILAVIAILFVCVIIDLQPDTVTSAERDAEFMEENVAVSGSRIIWMPEWECPKHGDLGFDCAMTFDGERMFCPVCVREIATKLLLLHGAQTVTQKENPK